MVGLKNGSSSDDHRDYKSESCSDLLCNDILVEILCRLPPKPLIRFKSVSKAFYSLISYVCVPRISPPLQPLSGLIFNSLDPSSGKPFTRYTSMPPFEIPVKDQPCCKYLTMSPPTNIKCDHTGEIVDSCDEPYSYSVSFYPSSDDFLDCCNGLFLFRRPSITQYCVFNPTTGHCVLIPTFNAHKRGAFAALIFNPQESHFYKIVRFLRGSSKCPGLRPLNVFSSETGKWVEFVVQLDPPIVVVPLITQCCYLGGSMYKLSMSWHLVRYDLKGVESRAIKLPDLASGTNQIECIGLCCGHLHYARNDGSRLLIWMLHNQYGADKWILKHSICLQDLAKHPLCSNLHMVSMSSWFQPRTFHPTSDAVVLYVAGSIMCYHLNNNKLEEVRRISGHNFVGHVFPFSRCFVPLRGFGKKQSKLNHL